MKTAILLSCMIATGSSTSAYASNAEQVWKSCVGSHWRFIKVAALTRPKQVFEAQKETLLSEIKVKCACIVSELEVELMEDDDARHLDYMMKKMFSIESEREGRADMELNGIDRQKTAALSLALVSKAPVCERSKN